MYGRNCRAEIHSKIKPIKSTASISYIPSHPHISSTSTYVVECTGLEYKTKVHANCMCNELLSLTNRHLVANNNTVTSHWHKIAQETQKFFNVKLQPVKYSEIINNYSAGKKKRYARARQNLINYGLTPKHSKIKMFVKTDKFPQDTIYNKAPRAIQYRSPEYNLSLLRYIKPIEEWVYPTLTYGAVSKTRTIVKGLNFAQRGELFMEKISYFKNPKFVSTDHSTFDATITLEHLKTTHKKYLKLIRSRRFYKLLQSQKHNKGVSKNGIKYEIFGTRMSGDADTGLGNSIVNADCLYGVLKMSGITKYDFMLDGDDSIIIIEDEDELNEEWFKKFGFTTKISYTKNYQHAEFCQSRLVHCPDPRFVRNPARAISHNIHCKKTFNIKDYGRWLLAIGYCENANYSGVPIYQALAKALLKYSGKPLFDENVERRMEGCKLTRVTREPLLLTRVSFSEAWDVSPSMQKLLEDEITSYYEARCDQQFGNVEQLAGTRARFKLCPESSSGCWWQRG